VFALFFMCIHIRRLLWLFPLQACIGLSCLLAIVCNLSQYMCLGRLSATSFQVSIYSIYSSQVARRRACDERLATCDWRFVMGVQCKVQTRLA